MQFTLSTVAAVASFLSVVAAAPTPRDGGFGGNSNGRGSDIDFHIEIQECSRRGSRFHWDGSRHICEQIDINVDEHNRSGRDFFPRDGDFGRDGNFNGHGSDIDFHIEIEECSRRGSRFHWDGSRHICEQIDINVDEHNRSGRDSGRNFRREAAPAPHDGGFGGNSNGRGSDIDFHIEIQECSRRGSRFHWDGSRHICEQIDINVDEHNSRSGRDFFPRDGDFGRDGNFNGHGSDIDFHIEIEECSRRGSRFHWDGSRHICEQIDININEDNSRSGRDSGRDSRFGGI